MTVSAKFSAVKPWPMSLVVNSLCRLKQEVPGCLIAMAKKLGPYLLSVIAIVLRVLPSSIP